MVCHYSTPFSLTHNKPKTGRKQIKEAKSAKNESHWNRDIRSPAAGFLPYQVSKAPSFSGGYVASD